MAEEKMVQAKLLKDFSAQALKSAGVPDGDARIVSDTMVEAELRGVATHGVMRLAPWMRMLREGNMNPRPNIRVVRETSATAVLDADNAMGNLGAVRAMEMAIKKVRTTSIAAIGVRNTTHCGALACFTSLAAEQGMIGFMTSNGPATVPPYGGKTRSMSTDPWSFAVPAAEELPIVLDMATTVAAGGKIRLASWKGEKIPLDWALDNDGVPTDDPVKAMTGLYQWIGGPKGYGLAVMTEVLAGVLTGGPFVKSMPPNTEPYGSSLVRQGNFVMAINIEAFMPLAEFTARVDRLIRDLKASERLKGVKEILLPGERGLRLKAERLKSGIPISAPVRKDLVALSDQLKLPVRLQ